METTPFEHPLPPEIQERVEHSQVILSIISDLDSKSDVGTPHLCLTKQELLLLEGGQLSAYPIEKIEEAYVVELYGLSRLDLKLKGENLPLINFSRSLTPEFATVARVITQQAQGKVIEFPEYTGGANCLRCGTPLSQRGANCHRCVSRWDVLKSFFPFLKPHIGKLSLIITGTLLAVGCQMIPPLLERQLIDDLLTSYDKEGFNQPLAFQTLVWICLGMIISYLGFSIFNGVANVCNSWLSDRVIADLRAKLHDKLQKVSMSYHNRHESGQLIGKVMNDTQEIHHFLIEGVPFLLVNTLTFFAIGAILFYISPFMALLAFGPVPLLFFGGAYFWKKLIPLFHHRGSKIGALHSVVGETIKGVRPIKAAARHDSRQEQFDGVNQGVFNISFRLNRTFIGFFEVMGVVMGISIALVWGLGSHAMITESRPITLGDLTAFVHLVALFHGPIKWFAAITNWMTHSMASAERLLHILEQKDETDPNTGLRPEKFEGDLEMVDLRFSYEKGKEVLKGVDFKIPKGTMVGLVGKSGAGKSTIINLFCRFHQPDSGMIRVDGHDLNDLNLPWWRRNIGIVMQDPFLFQGTLTENIAYCKPDASFDDIVKAAKAAHAHEFILDKEDAYDTMVGDGGINLSGGEKQRIAIARAILHDPPFLILDEATSAVDSETEEKIQTSIQELVKGRTTIAIAHRLATLRNADHLIVVNDGLVVEEGTHKELIHREDGHFRKLVDLQTKNNRIRSETIEVGDV